MGTGARPSRREPIWWCLPWRSTCARSCVGRPADRIEDTWQMSYNSSYWRNGPVLNNAISGVDQALWDIKGRQAGMPVYHCSRQVPRSGGKLHERRRERRGPDCRGARKAMRKAIATFDFRSAFPACQRMDVGARRGSTQGPGPPQRPGLRARPYIRRTVKMLEECRKQLGDEIELLHDIHERISPREAVQFAKDVEPVKLFFLEDAVSPEDIAYFRQIRQQSNTARSPWASCSTARTSGHRSSRAADRLRRIHISQAGGLTPCGRFAVRQNSSA